MQRMRAHEPLHDSRVIWLLTSGQGRLRRLHFVVFIGLFGMAVAH
jgi:hypothetical protein